MPEQMEKFEGQICPRNEKGEGKEEWSPGPPYTPKWERFEMLMFLKDQIRHRKKLNRAINVLLAF